jgi:DNA-binding MarR family transcriptional regulator
VLTLIAENPGGSPARLARALAVTPPHITALVDRLVARGLVQRRANDEDRRAQILAVTRAGADLVRKATERIVAGERAALALTPGEQVMLAELLHKVACAREPRS